MSPILLNKNNNNQELPWSLPLVRILWTLSQSSRHYPNKLLNSKKFLEYSREHSIQCNSQYNAILNTMQVPIQFNSQYNAIPNTMQFLKQCNSQYNAIPNTIQFSIQCNFQYIAILNTIQFPMQCNSQYNAIPITVQFPKQCKSQCNAIPKTIPSGGQLTKCKLHIKDDCW